MQSVQQLDSRLYDVSLSSTAVDGNLHVRVLLPDGYGQNPTRRYPVLYLFPGTGNSAADWTEQRRRRGDHRGPSCDHSDA